MPSDPFARISVIVSLAVALLIALILLQVLLLAASSRRNERHRRAFDLQWRPLIAATMLGDQVTFPPLDGRERIWFLLLWNRTLADVKGTARTALAGMLSDTGMDAHARRLLDSPWERDRVIATATLAARPNPEDWSRMEALIGTDHPTQRVLAAHGLLAIDATRALACILPPFAANALLPQAVLDDICQRAGQDGIDAVLPSLLKQPDARPPDMEARLWRLIIHGSPTQMRRLVLDNLDTVPEVALDAALIVLRRAGNPVDANLARAYLEHGSSVIRAEAVQAYGSLTDSADARSALLTKLADPDWAVRQRAADGLATLPDTSEAALQALMDTVTDPFGRDALRRAMADRSPQ